MGRSAVLIGHSRRFLAFFQETRLVHHQHPVCVPQMLDHIPAQFIAYRFLIPIRLGQEPLHPMRAAFAQLFGELPAVLALDGGQQGTQEAARAGPGFCAAEMRPKALLYLG